MIHYPTDPKKLRAQLKRYEKSLKAPNHRDGAGKRFLVGQFYLMLGDLEGAANFYKWYKRKFSEDIPEPFNHLCWILCLLRSDKIKDAKTKLRELVFFNVYTVPLVLGQNPKPYSFQHASNWEVIEYITEGPTDQIFPLWNKDELSWLETAWNEKLLQDDLKRFIDIDFQLDKLPVGDERSALISEQFKIKYGDRFEDQGFFDDDNVVEIIEARKRR
jgi:hypothetical protein